VKNEKVDPLGDNIVSPRAHDFLEVSHFVRLQRKAPDDSTVADRRNESIDNDYLGP
jgi:hypothetical protein